MKKLCIVFILFVTLFPKLDAQIFYNIEKPPSYQKFGLTSIKDLPTLNYAVDGNGNCYKDKLSDNMKDYLKIEKIDGKNIARIKFNVASKSLGEMTLRFSNVQLKNGAYCYVFTTDYQIVAGPIYQKSINDLLNIVKIPANELILEMVSNSEQDYNLNLSSISFQSNDDLKPKRKNSLQDETNWDCDNYGINGNSKYCDNISEAYTENSASYLGAWYDCELLTLQNLYSVNDKNIAASRASCIIMEPPHFSTESPFNWIDYWGANAGTLMNFPESDCEGIIFTVYHNAFIQQLCDITIKYNVGPISADEQAILNNTLIRFNWHHKYGKPIHLTGCSQSDFALWRKTIDFNEVIDYCGVSAVAYGDGRPAFGDYAILKMKQMPFYKELHLGWTTQRLFDYNSSSRILNNPSDFSIMGRHAATPTYLFKNSDGTAQTIQDVPIWVTAINLTVISPNDPPAPQPPNPPRNFSGWSGSQLLYPYYNNTTERIGLGIQSQGNSTSLTGYTYRALFYLFGCIIIDPNLQIVSPSQGDDLYNKYLIRFLNDTTVFKVEDDFYWMPSVENREKCPSPMASETEPCDFNFSNFIKVEYKDGKMIFTIDIGGLSPSLFPGGQYPKGIRIYRASGDQQTFFFDTFADSIDIGPTIKFTINPCDLFYYQMMGNNPILLGFDFYDSEGKILNDYGCNMTYSYPFPNINPCEQISITTDRISEPPIDLCCSYKIEIQLNVCDDYSNIVRLMLENMSLVNLSNNDTTTINIQNGLIIDHINGKINFTINNICDTTDFRLIGLFGGNENCESFDFTLDCVVPEPPCDCCKVYHATISPVIGYSPIGGGTIIIEPHQFLIDFSGMGNRKYQKYCPDCQFLFADAYCANPNPSPSDSTPVFEETMTANQFGFYEGYYGSFDGYNPDTYCLYFVIHTNEGICYDTLCVDYDGTYWRVAADSPEPIIEINLNNNTNPYCPLTTQLDYEQIYIIDLNDKVLIESNPIDKIDVSKLTAGTYTILYRKKDKIIDSQKLSIKK